MSFSSTSCFPSPPSPCPSLSLSALPWEAPTFTSALPTPSSPGGWGRVWGPPYSISSLPQMETSASSAHLCFQLTQLFLMCAKLIGQKLLSSRRVSPARPTSWLSARASLYYTCNQDASPSHPHCILVVINYIAQIPKEPLNVSIPWSFISKWAR